MVFIEKKHKGSLPAGFTKVANRQDKQDVAAPLDTNDWSPVKVTEK